MHLNARFNAHGDENKVVCNSYQGGNWCEEVREGGFPFHQGKEFQVSPEPFKYTRFYTYFATLVSVHYIPVCIFFLPQ